MKFQLHVSGLNLLSRCGIAFERRYIRNEPELRSVSLAVGSAVDQAVTADLRAKIESGALLPTEQVADMARDFTVDEWARDDIRLNQEDSEDGWNGSKDEAIDASVAMAVHYHRYAAPGIRPTHVQRRWALDIRGLDIQMAGTIDVQEGLDAIRDTKTSAKSPVKDAAEKSLQLTTYALAVMAHDKQLPAAVALDYVVRTPKRKDMKLVQLVSIRTEGDIYPLLNRMESASKVIESGMFSPAPADAWWCNSKFCGYWASCSFSAKPSNFAIGGAA